MLTLQPIFRCLDLPFLKKLSAMFVFCIFQNSLLQFADNRGCEKDKLIISDGRGRPIPRCGIRDSSVPRPRTFDTRELKVEFITDAAVGKRGFHINYNLTAQPQRGEKNFLYRQNKNLSVSP